jgi:hypothetical protein
MSAASRAWIAAACACLGGPATAAGEVPFEATLAVREVVAFTLLPPCFAVGALTGSGRATSLGPVSAVSQDCINPLGEFDPAAGSYHFASTGTGLVFKTVDGSVVHATYSGTLSHRAGAPHEIAGHFVITGGTGRYARASGGGTLSGYEDISGVVLGVGQVVFRGTLVIHTMP